MGLDVYLYHYEDFENGHRAEEEYSRRTESLWEKGVSEAHRERQCAAIAAELGLLENKYGHECAKTEISRDSTKYPGHMFKVGYLRSSYNDGGINSTLRAKGLPDLYWVFEPNGRYHFAPDWRQAKERIVELRARYFAAVEAGWKGKYFVRFVGLNPFIPPASLPDSEAKALDLFGAELERQKAGGATFESYSNGSGEFTREGLKLFGAIPGIGGLKSPGVYLVFENQKPSDGDWYAQALEITEEMIDYVLAQPDPEKHILHWSS